MMKKRMKLAAASVLVGLLLAGCGNSSSSKTSNGGTSNGGTSNKESSGQQIIDDVVSQLTKDLVVEDGEPLFEEEVTIEVWSIIGDPDKAVQEKLFAAFNDEFLGQIQLKWTHIGHFDFYTNLDTTWTTDRESIPDVLFMHNEKTIQYAAKDYLWSLDSLFGDNATGVEFDFDQIYSNIDRVTKYNGNRYAIPVDAHGFLTSFRQDIIKKNGLGWDNNTRYIPESRAEYNDLLQNLRTKADAGELWIRDINKGSNHAWKKANASSFYPSFMQSTDPDGLSALYANGGTLMSEDQSTVEFHNNKGFQTYVTDQVDRYNNKLMGDGTSTALFGVGNTVMFSEGPWYVSQQYDAMYNNSELTRVSEALGVTEEDANDPVYSKPYVASHPKDWWTLEENMNSDTAGKWYGNGHAISITKECKSLAKVAAALVFAKWYTQGTDINDDTQYNLTTWCSSGHIPAWKNIYESEDYQEELEGNMTLRALGNPEDIIAMEGLVYESTIFDVFGSSISSAQTLMKGGNATKESALQIIKESAESLQTTIDFLILQDSGF